METHWIVACILGCLVLLSLVIWAAREGWGEPLADFLGAVFEALFAILLVVGSCGGD